MVQEHESAAEEKGDKMKETEHELNGLRLKDFIPYINSTDYVEIYVPDSLVSNYKSTYPWSTYASKIFAKDSN